MDKFIKQITTVSDHVTDIFKLPVVKYVYKSMKGEPLYHVKVSYKNGRELDDNVKVCVAKFGDRLIEYQDGTWELDNLN